MISSGIRVDLVTLNCRKRVMDYGGIVFGPFLAMILFLL